jgi:hypothetical protein
MARKIETWDELEKSIMEDVAESLSESDKLTYVDNDSPTFVLRHALDTEFYAKYVPKEYDPYPPRITGESIKGSKSILKGNTATMEVYHDTDMMSKYAGLQPEGYYRYTQDDVDISYDIPDMIEEGNIYPYGMRTGYTETAVKNLEDGQLHDYLVKRLKAKGWDTA